MHHQVITLNCQQPGHMQRQARSTSPVKSTFRLVLVSDAACRVKTLSISE